MVDWGEWSNAGSNGIRLGINAWWGPVDGNSSAIALTYQIYTENRYWINDFQWLDFIHDSSRLDFNNQNGAGEQVLRCQYDLVYSYPAGSYEVSPGSLAIDTRLGGAYNGSAPVIQRWYAIPARPYLAPAAPPWLTATRISDTDVRLTWGHTQPDNARYTSQLIQRREWSAGGWGAWADYASLDGTTSELYRTDHQSNRVYHYRIRSGNGTGVSGWTESSASVWMTPAAPTNVTAALQSNGSVVVSWTNNHYYSTTPGVTLVVERSADGVAWTQVATGVTGSSWTDPTPLVGPNRYRAAAFISQGSLRSLFAASNSIDTVGTPIPPTSVTLSSIVGSTLSISFGGHQLSAGDPRKWVSVRAYVSVNDGAYIQRGSMNVSSPSDNALSVNEPGLGNQAKVRVYLVSVNAAGESSPAYSGFRYTTPNPPTSVSAVRAGWVSEDVAVTWAAYPHSGAQYTVARFAPGAPAPNMTWTVSTNSFSTTVPLGSSAEFAVMTITPDSKTSAASARSVVPARVVDKSKIPGVTEIYQGSALVRSVVQGSTTIWLR